MTPERQYITLADQMSHMLWSLRNHIKQGERDRGKLCRELADLYELWDRQQSLPAWLRWVVEGELNDFLAEEGWWYRQEG